MAFKPKLVKADDEAPDVDPDLLKIAHDFLAAVAAGEVVGAAIIAETDEVMGFTYAGEFDAYAFDTFARRRFGELLDAMEYGEGEEH